MRLITVPVQKKLVDDEAISKLLERVDQLKQNYRPEQGWIDAPENAVVRSVPTKEKN